MTSRLCEIEGCGKPHEARGWCRTHYKRWRMNGTPHLKAAPDRLWGNVEKNAHGCWVWKGTKNRKGYGQISVDGRHERTHRVAYRLTYGEIPEGMVVRHRCDNPPCINPDHLEVGTSADNSRDMVERGRMVNCKVDRDKCPKGHSFDEVNTYWWNNARQCKACKNEYQVSKRDRLNPRRNRKVVGEERRLLRARAVELHALGFTLKEIGTGIGRSKELARGLLVEAGVPPRPRSYRKPLEKAGE